MAKILIIDDEQAICWAFQQLLTSKGHTVAVSASAEDGLIKIETEKPELVILDIRLPGMNGLDALEKIRQTHGDLPVIMITAHGTMDTAIEAIKKKAYDYLTKPIDIQTAMQTINRALDSRGNKTGTADFTSPPAPYNLVGNSHAIQDVFKKIGAVSMSGVNVLLIGESGTGKELVARAIHHHSARTDSIFEPVNCAALPETLLESELFGHDKGAFTGAIKQMPGKFELADSGTIFLDEISEIPLSSQAKLLRFIETKSFERIGGIKPINVDVRIIAATNRDIEKMTKDGSFREDLFYRLNVVSIVMPPLRERKEDIPLLTSHFFALHNAGHRALSDNARNVLMSHNWPGNVREFKNAIEYALTISRSSTIQMEDLPEYLFREKSDTQTPIASIIESFIKDMDMEKSSDVYARIMDKFEGPFIARIHALTQHNQMQTSKILGISRSTLIKKLKKYNIL
ncbi:MAG: sigma-54-dependent Fis family transcriptional regulator [Planctomycetes bacterium]|nr:sigma-54-dependent Fis family transcriptional regulator [Planctomycetota bacterium]